jgi:lambda repressor-like predicted transcriptional regulator
MEMIREAIIESLKEKNISMRRCAVKNGLIYQNFYGFLKGNRSLPLDDIEKVLIYLGLEICKK